MTAILVKKSDVEKVRETLAKTHWSQAHYARLIGVHPSLITRWLSGKRLPTDAQSLQIRRIYVNAILGRRFPCE